MDIKELEAALHQLIDATDDEENINNILKIAGFIRKQKNIISLMVKLYNDVFESDFNKKAAMKELAVAMGELKEKDYA